MSQTIDTPPTTAYSVVPSATEETQGESSRKGSISSSRWVVGNKVESQVGRADNSGESYHAQALASYLFSAGYATSAWADVQLVFFGQDAKLHRRECLVKCVG